MRSQRWVAATLIAGAVWIGGLSGCGGGNQGGENAPSGSNEANPPAPETSAPAPPAGGEAVPAGEVSLALGQKVIKEKCELCHGASGKGDGPGGAALNPKPRNWTDHGYMGSQTDDQLREVIFNGKGSMPAWGKSGLLTETEIRSAIMAVRTYDSDYKGAN